MKTNKITLMIMGLAVASLFASCKKNDNAAAVGEGFRAFTEQGGNGSRTHGVADGNTIAVQWTSGDQILVANQGGAGSQLTYNLKSGANSTEGSFANTNESSDFLQPDYVAIYPATNAAGVANSISGTTATFNLPATQTYLEGSFAEKSMPMVAYSSEQELQFNNVLGGLCFPIVGEGYTITKIEVVSANTSEALWGECTTTISATDDPTSTVSNTDANKNVITIDCGSGIVLNPTTAADFYVMVPAGTLESGFTVKAYNGTEVIYEKSTENAPGAGFIPRGVVRRAQPDLSVEFIVTTVSPTFITMNSAKAMGMASLMFDEKGLLYANIDELNGDPDALVVGGSGVHQLISSSSTINYDFQLSNLDEDKVHYVRAYAIAPNNAIIYGNAIPFATRKNYESTTYNGKMPYPFSIAPGTTTYFSSGNLQYMGSASTPYWKFADEQFVSLGECNASSAQNVDRDIFSWGTSNYDHGGYCWHPYERWSEPGNFYAYNSKTANLYDNTGKADWGYNAIINGGNTENQWRTLTGDEWVYLLATRTVSINGSTNARCAKAKVFAKNNEEFNGLLVFPDNMVWPVELDASHANHYPAEYCGGTWNGESDNWWTEAEWSLLEKAGTVFLPTPGLYFSGSYMAFGAYGGYWGATTKSIEGDAFMFHFTGSVIQGIYPDVPGFQDYIRKDGCFAVRLVRK